MCECRRPGGTLPIAEGLGPPSTKTAQENSIKSSKKNSEEWAGAGNPGKSLELTVISRNGLERAHKAAGWTLNRGTPRKTNKM